MSESSQHPAADETAVNDVRRVREQLQRESGGDLRKHVEHSNRVLTEFAERLGVKVLQPPPRHTRRDGTRG
jgi:hypothetical protein